MDHEKLCEVTKSLCEELKKNQMTFIQRKARSSNGGSGEVDLLLERVQTLEQLVINLVKRVEVDESVLPVEKLKVACLKSGDSDSASSVDKGFPFASSNSRHFNFGEVSADQVDTTTASTTPLSKVVNVAEQPKPPSPLKVIGYCQKSSGHEDDPILPDERLRKYKLVKPKPGPLRFIPAPTYDSNADTKTLFAGIKRYFLAGSKDCTNNTINEFVDLPKLTSAVQMEDVVELIFKQSLEKSETAALGANIYQGFCAYLPKELAKTFFDTVLCCCQKEFRRILEALDTSADSENQARGVLHVLAQLSIHLKDPRNDKQVKILALAVVELIRKLMSTQTSNQFKENVMCAREVMQLMKPNLLAHPVDKNMQEELIKLGDLCENVRPPGLVSAEVKRHLLVTKCLVKKTLDSLSLVTLRPV